MILFRRDAAELLGEATPAEGLADVREMIKLNGKEAAEAHTLKTCHVGKGIFTKFDVVVPRL